MREGNGNGRIEVGFHKRDFSLAPFLATDLSLGEATKTHQI